MAFFRNGIDQLGMYEGVSIANGFLYLVSKGETSGYCRGESTAYTVLLPSFCVARTKRR